MRTGAGGRGQLYNLGSKDNTIVSFSVPLTPDQWSNVYGQRDSKSFYAALANVGWIGVTFGGQYFWGHGSHAQPAAVRNTFSSVSRLIECPSEFYPISGH